MNTGEMKRCLVRKKSLSKRSAIRLRGPANASASRYRDIYDLKPILYVAQTDKEWAEFFEGFGS